jgi:glycosyltransferase involved in cell wall biosynthesis
VKVALLSRAFLPSVGGVETSTAMIAATWQSAGHDVEVVTAVPDPSSRPFPYRVTRAWTLTALRRALAGAEVAVTNGYSRVAAAVAALERKPLTIFHQGYQLICSDGVGFRERTFHGFRTLEDLKLAFAAGRGQAARALARLPFDAVVRAWPAGLRHVVPSRHVGRRLGLARYEVIYQPPNPAVVDALAALGPPSADARAAAYATGDILCFARLVFEKGCDDLVRAYARFREGAARALSRPLPRLIIHGDGPERPVLEELVRSLGLGRDVELSPFVNGEELAKAARRASLVVVPSHWEEPGATIAVELFACGAAVVASETGAQGEIFDGGHGRLFPNGDVEALAAALAQHFSAGPVYPRPSGSEPWTVPTIQRALLNLLQPSE